MQDEQVCQALFRQESRTATRSAGLTRRTSECWPSGAGSPPTR